MQRGRGVFLKEIMLLSQKSQGTWRAGRFWRLDPQAEVARRRGVCQGEEKLELLMGWGLGAVTWPQLCGSLQGSEAGLQVIMSFKR